MLVLLGTLPALGQTVYGSVRAQRQATLAVQADALRLTHLAAANQKQWVEGARQVLILLTQLPEVASSDNSVCSARLASLSAQFPDYLNMGVVLPSGDVVCSVVPFTDTVNVADRLYFQRALQTRDLAMSSYQVGRITGKPSLSLGYPSLDDSGQVRAVVFVSLDLARLNRIAAETELRLPEGAALTVLDGQGIVVARYPDPKNWVGRQAAELPLVDVLTTQRDGTTVQRGLDGVERLYAFTAIGKNGEDLFVSVGIPLDAAFAQVRHDLVLRLVGLVLVLLLAVGVAWLGGEVILFHRLGLLGAAAQRVGAGDLQARSGLGDDPDELGDLARAFDQMAAELDTRAQAREKLETQLRQSQKMEAIGMLAGGVAHDFNNLLTVISGNAELALGDLPAGQPLHKELDAIYNAARRAATLTRQLLSFSRRRTLQPRRLNINALVTEFSSMLERVLGAQIELVLELSPEIKSVVADQDALEQVLMNLAVNAQDAMPRGGQLTLATAPALLDDAFVTCHPELAPGEYVRLTVADTGVGMSEDMLQHLFEPFFTTKDVGKGTGLGLSVIYGIVAQHAGCIEVHSEVGNGTRFAIYLPVSSASADAATEDVHPPPQGGHELILLAEDEPQVRELAAQVLRSLGYTVLEASDGEQAVRLFVERPQRINLVMLDLVMPRLTGDKAYQVMSSIRADVPVVFISGYSAELAGLSAEAIPGVLLRKPFAVADLARCVREVLERAQRAAAQPQNVQNGSG